MQSSAGELSAASRAVETTERHPKIPGFLRDECRLGEELFDRMRERYFDTGLGFNIQTSGLSNIAPINGLQKRYVSVPLILCGFSTTDSRLFLVYLNIC
jgi:hypothetical protein